MTQSLTTIVLAAGKGTRMKSSRAKVLHEVFFAPMVHHVVHALETLNPKQNIVVVGHQREEVEASLQEFPVDFAVQTEQLGTGHAVLAAEKESRIEDGVVMILCGDTPLILSETLQAMFEQHVQSGATLTLMTTILDNPTNYGRIISSADGEISRIVEEKDADIEQKKIREINAGIYCVDRDFLFSSLKNVGTDNSQGEVYLTDIVGMAVEQGKGVKAFVNPVPEDVLGVNSRVELAQAHQELLMRRNRQVMLQGVTMEQPETITIEPGVVVEADCHLSQGVVIKGQSHIGKRCVLENGTIIVDSTLEENVQIGPYAVLEKQTIIRDTVVEAQTCLKDV